LEVKKKSIYLCSPQREEREKKKALNILKKVLVVKKIVFTFATSFEKKEIEKKQVL